MEYLDGLKDFIIRINYELVFIKQNFKRWVRKSEVGKFSRDLVTISSHLEIPKSKHVITLTHSSYWVSDCRIRWSIWIWRGIARTFDTIHWRSTRTWTTNNGIDQAIVTFLTRFSFTKNLINFILMELTVKKLEYLIQNYSLLGLSNDFERFYDDF